MMNPSIFLSNTLIGIVLASQITQYWWRRQKDRAIFHWMMGAWILTASDAVFAARRTLPVLLGLLLPTLLVSIGHGVLFLGAQQAAGLARRGRAVSLVIGLQAVGLIILLFAPHVANSRMVFNGVFWAGFSFASAWCMRRAPNYFWDSLTAPAAVFLAQGIFHVLRIAAAILFDAEGWARASLALHFVSDIEVSVFMGALFIALLLAHLHLRHDELAGARVEVQTLSGLLPVCAWCKKIRDDDGYWTEIMEHFTKRSGVRVTHGICDACAAKMKERENGGLQP